ncbi:MULTISPECIES: hypothetical protein [Burkholderia]|uniref:Uncharacterized protein n=1 Tax=Burkholderia seminalis TaxID=488731 RepID=A0A8A8DDJ3_9BURK|nr:MULTISPECIES: hypothetical protein [Burkholderia]MBN3741984.1 hypothetical protein [Burkholderia sp. Tr-20355]QTO22726.1 hypothetical protein DT99_022910 [Burkholderia seminalis]
MVKLLRVGRETKVRRKYRNALRARGRRRGERTFPDPARVLHKTDMSRGVRARPAVFT